MADIMSSQNKVLICGASGFIGKNLALYFSKKQNCQVIGTYFKREPPDIPNVIFKKVDLRDPKQIDELLSGVDIVIQAAATTSGAKDIVGRPYIHVTDNAVMNSYLLKSSFDHKIKHFIFFSCTVMYPADFGAPLKETDFDPTQVYPKYFGVGWTKVYIEKMCEFFSSLGETKYTAIRHSNIYGPHDKFDLEKSHVLGATITKVQMATDTLSVWGEGKETRDFLYIDDLVKFVDLAIEKQSSKYELVNLGLGHSVSISDLIEKVIKISGKNLKVEHDLSKPTIPTKVAVDISKAKKLFGWIPAVDLETGLQKTISWHKEHIGDKT